MDSPMKVFAGVWLMVVVSVITVMALCKLGGAWFTLNSQAVPQTAAQVYQHQCYESQQGEENGVANTGGAPSTWTCAIPKGETH